MPPKSRFQAFCDACRFMAIGCGTPMGLRFIGWYVRTQLDALGQETYAVLCPLCREQTGEGEREAQRLQGALWIPVPESKSCTCTEFAWSGFHDVDCPA